jgi:cytochrome oxidase Cu insertion factor (SCO1/SenC/PrrC family)
MMRMKKVIVSWVVCVLLAVLLFATFGRPNTASTAGGDALIRAEFTLQNGEGKTVAAKDFEGKYLLVFFGFTHCPNICPTTLMLMSNVLSKMGTMADKIQPIFITVDPARDTPKITSDYARRFGDNFIGLSGTPEQTKTAENAFKVFSNKTSDEKAADGYTMDHSGFIYLMSPKGEYISHFSADSGEQELQQGLRDAVK